MGYYLAGSKCKPNLCQKSLLSIAVIGLSIFFFASTAESRATFLKLSFRQSVQVGMDDNLLTILRFEIQSSAFVFLNI